MSVMQATVGTKLPSGHVVLHIRPSADAYEAIPGVHGLDRHIIMGIQSGRRVASMVLQQLGWAAGEWTEEYTGHWLTELTNAVDLSDPGRVSGVRYMTKRRGTDEYGRISADIPRCGAPYLDGTVNCNLAEGHDEDGPGYVIHEHIGYAAQPSYGFNAEPTATWLQAACAFQYIANRSQPARESHRG